MLVPKPLRVAGLFLANLFAAVIGTAIIDSGIVLRILHPATKEKFVSGLVAEEVVSAWVALILGYFGFRLLKSGSAKWIWIVGVCWFGQRVLGIWIKQRMVRTLTGSRGIDLLGLSSFDPAFSAEAFDLWASYTIPFIRTVFYSIGAYCSSRRYSALDPRTPLSDDVSNAHPAPSPDMREPIRPDRPS